MARTISRSYRPKEPTTWPKVSGRRRSAIASFRSFRHFVGSVEQNAENTANGTAARDRAGSNVINHVYAPTLGVAYGVTNQFSVAADLPYFHAHRRSPGRRRAGTRRS
jgi:hypothetical protein